MNTSRSYFRPFGWCFALLVVGNTLSGCATYPICKSGNCVNGQGTMTYVGGVWDTTYVGEFKDGLHHGQGTLTWLMLYEHGNKYVGEWKDGQYDGQGTFTWPDGGQYVGEYRDGKQHGQGTYTAADGSVQRGMWVNGQFQESPEGTPRDQAPVH